MHALPGIMECIQIQSDPYWPWCCQHPVHGFRCGRGWERGIRVLRVLPPCMRGMRSVTNNTRTSMSVTSSPILSKKILLLARPCFTLAQPVPALMLSVLLLCI